MQFVDFEALAPTVSSPTQMEMEPQGQSSPWILSLLEVNFFVPCSLHENVKKNEKNVFCLDCRTSICLHCRENHSAHRLLQVFFKEMESYHVTTLDLRRFFTRFEDTFIVTSFFSRIARNCSTASPFRWSLSAIPFSLVEEFTRSCSCSGTSQTTPRCYFCTTGRCPVLLRPPGDCACPARDISSATISVLSPARYSTLR